MNETKLAMNWKIKGVTQKILSAVPGGVWLNDRMQRTVGELRNFEDVVDSKVVDDWLVLASHLRKMKRPANREADSAWMAPANREADFAWMAPAAFARSPRNADPMARSSWSRAATMVL